MMIGAVPTFRFTPSLNKTDLHLTPSAITIPFTRQTILRHRGSHNGGSSTYLVRRSSYPTAVEASSTPNELDSAASVVRNFYGGINRRDLASVESLIALNCVYEDLIFSQPFVGRKAILEFFGKFIDSISADLQFAIDEISEEDNTAVGVTWHLEWKGKPFPFSRGCSFYRLDVFNGQRQITFGRDAVEPAIKPGEAALVAIKGVTWLLHNLPFLADRL